MVKKINKLKNSDYCFIFSDRKGHYAWHHALTGETLFGDSRLHAVYSHFTDYNVPDTLSGWKKLPPQLLTELQKQQFLVSRDSSDRALLTTLQQAVRARRYIKTLYLSLTYKCNFKCRYCISNNSIALNDAGKLSIIDMDDKVARLAADFYLKNVQANGDKEVVFYGGEPLINFRILRYLVEYISGREKDRRNRNPSYKKTRFILCTNGSLINNEIAHYLKKNKIYPAVTFDGDEETHNATRRYGDGRATYRDVLKKYRLLKSLNFPVGATLTLGRHNVNNLPKLVGFLADELSPNTMATNTMIDYEDGGNAFVCTGQEIAKSLIRAFQVAREKGIYLVKYVMDNRVKPFVEKKPRLKGCTGTGSRVMVLPDGTVTMCAAYARKSKIRLQDRPALNDYMPDGISLYSPFFKTQCRSCYAIACCGGGCPINAERLHGSYWDNDDDYCVQSREFFRFLVWDLFTQIDPVRLQRDGFAIATTKERKKIYGKIRVSKTPLDFQYTPNIDNA